jgi:hypothetical protein
VGYLADVSSRAETIWVDGGISKTPPNQRVVSPLKSVLDFEFSGIAESVVFETKMRTVVPGGSENLIKTVSRRCQNGSRTVSRRHQMKRRMGALRGVIRGQMWGKNDALKHISQPDVAKLKILDCR